MKRVRIEIRAQVAVEVAEKVFRIDEKVLTKYVGVCHLKRMPGQRSPDKMHLSAWMSRAFYRRVEKLAQARGETVTDLVVSLLVKATENIVLTAEDYENIAKETRKAAERMGSKRTKR